MTPTVPGAKLRVWRRTHFGHLHGDVASLATARTEFKVTVAAFTQPALAAWLAPHARRIGHTVSARSIRRWEAGRCPRWAYEILLGACE